MILQRHGRTDRQMDGQNSISISRVSVLMRDKVTGQRTGQFMPISPSRQANGRLTVVYPVTFNIIHRLTWTWHVYTMCC